MTLTTSIQANAITCLNPPTLLDTSAYGFAQVVVAPNRGHTVYLSGQSSSDTQGNIVGQTMAEQIAQAFKNLKCAIQASGAKPEHVVKVQLLVVDHQEDYVGCLQAELKALFGNHLPASTLIPVPRLALDSMRFEIDATLVILD
ncbi:RidA family protein [Pseudomonas sp. SDO528_S397]